MEDFLISVHPLKLSSEKGLYQLIQILNEAPLINLSMLLKTMHLTNSIPFMLEASGKNQGYFRVVGTHQIILGS